MGPNPRASWLNPPMKGRHSNFLRFQQASSDPIAFQYINNKHATFCSLEWPVSPSVFLNLPDQGHTGSSVDVALGANSPHPHPVPEERCVSGPVLRSAPTPNSLLASAVSLPTNGRSQHAGRQTVLLPEHTLGPL